MSASVRQLEAIWKTPAGLRALKAVNHGAVGKRFVLTGCAFFLVAGTIAMLIRSQLTFAGNDLLGARDYNAAFTLHGTAMMFLFAIPALQGLAIYLVPKMIGARDLVYPRLAAYAYWCYLVGGLALLGSIFFGAPPDDGWVLSMPLSTETYAPDAGPDAWLIGTLLSAISAIACAIAIAVSILKTRAPGMTLDRMPLFVWASLLTAALILCTFPSLLAAALLLGLSRAFGVPVFVDAAGGDPLLWQHLFWLSEHWLPVLLFLPAAGIVSSIVSTATRQPIAGYKGLVAAMLMAVAVSFAGSSALAGLALSASAAIHVWVWGQTLWHAKPAISVPLLYVYGALVTFVIGGLSGLVLSLDAFDAMARDSQFFVAQLHYMLFGGIVLPMLAGLYHWLPLVTGRTISRRGSRLAFALVIGGFHLTFLPLFALGLGGMPNRIYTYPDGLGWELFNFAATLGGYATAVGMGALVLDLLLHVRFGSPAPRNVWHAGTLEWALSPPLSPYNFVSQPYVRSRDPLWDLKTPWDDAGARDLSTSRSNRRETLATGLIDAEPEHLILLPDDSSLPPAAAVCTGLLLLAALFAHHVLAAAVVVALGVTLWRWATGDRTERQRKPSEAATAFVPLPHASASAAAWWGSAAAALAGIVLFGSLLFAFFNLTHAPGNQPFVAAEVLNFATPAAALVLFLLSSALLHHSAYRLAIAAACAGAALQLTALATSGLSPASHAVDALALTIWAYVLIHLGMAIAVAASALRTPQALTPVSGELSARALVWHLSIAQCVAAALTIYGSVYLAN